MTIALTTVQIREAAQRLRGYVRQTPVLEVDGDDFGLPGVTLVLKQEYLQHAGSFKTRGALTHLLTREIPAAGVVAASGGNHGCAVAYAARRMGKQATIFVPGVCPPGKRELIARLTRDSGIDLTQSFAYGDSPGDVELLEMVGHPLVVNPIRGMDRIAQRNGWPTTT